MMTERDRESGNEELALLVRRAVKKHAMIEPGDRVMCCVSGGADSVALLSVMLELAEQQNFTVAAAHLNHMLRADESDGDEQYVRELCGEFGVPLYCESLDAAGYSAERKMGIEQGARELRYKFFERAARGLCANKIATAHTADDNLETTVFNLTRGAGLSGLCGIPPKRGNIIRPLIYSGRAEIIEYLKKEEIIFRTDSSNLCADYSRNKIRINVIPVLKSINPSADKTAEYNSDMLRADAEFIAAAVSKACERLLDGTDAMEISEFNELPEAIAGRVLSEFHQRHSESGRLSARHIEIITDFMRNPEQNKRLTLPGGVVFEKISGQLKIRDMSGREIEICQRELQIGGQTDICEAGISIKCEIVQKKCDKDKENEKNATTFYINCDKINEPLVVRARKTGDKMSVYPRNVTKTLKKLMNEKKIKPDERGVVPVIACGDDVVAAYKTGLNAEYAAGSDCKCLKISFYKI